MSTLQLALLFVGAFLQRCSSAVPRYSPQVFKGGLRYATKALTSYPRHTPQASYSGPQRITYGLRNGQGRIFQVSRASNFIPQDAPGYFAPVNDTDRRAGQSDDNFNALEGTAARASEFWDVFGTGQPLSQQAGEGVDNVKALKSQVELLKGATGKELKFTNAIDTSRPSHVVVPQDAPGYFASAFDTSRLASQAPAEEVSAQNELRARVPPELDVVASEAAAPAEEVSAQNELGARVPPELDVVASKPAPAEEMSAQNELGARVPPELDAVASKLAPAEEMSAQNELGARVPSELDAVASKAAAPAEEVNAPITPRARVLPELDGVASHAAPVEDASAQNAPGARVPPELDGVASKSASAEEVSATKVPWARVLPELDVEAGKVAPAEEVSAAKAPGARALPELDVAADKTPDFEVRALKGLGQRTQDPEPATVLASNASNTEVGTSIEPSSHSLQPSVSSQASTRAAHETGETATGKEQGAGTVVSIRRSRAGRLGAGRRSKAADAEEKVEPALDVGAAVRANQTRSVAANQVTSIPQWPESQIAPEAHVRTLGDASQEGSPDAEQELATREELTSQATSSAPNVRTTLEPNEPMIQEPGGDERDGATSSAPKLVRGTLESNQPISQESVGDEGGHEEEAGSSDNDVEALQRFSDQVLDLAFTTNRSQTSPWRASGGGETLKGLNGKDLEFASAVDSKRPTNRADGENAKLVEMLLPLESRPSDLQQPLVEDRSHVPSAFSAPILRPEASDTIKAMRASVKSRFDALENLAAGNTVKERIKVLKTLVENGQEAEALRGLVADEALKQQFFGLQRIIESGALAMRIGEVHNPIRSSEPLMERPTLFSPIPHVSGVSYSQLPRQQPSARGEVLKGLDGIFFNLDNCLYPFHGSGMAQYEAEIAKRFLTRRGQSLTSEQATFWQENKFSVGALLHLRLPPSVLAEYKELMCSQLPYSDLVSYDARLRAELLEIPGPRYVLSNNFRCHAERVLSCLGVSDLFADVIAVDDVNDASSFTTGSLILKPQPSFYRLAMRRVGARSGLMIDDWHANCVGAMTAGMFVVQLARHFGAGAFLNAENSEPGSSAIPVIFSLRELPAILDDNSFVMAADFRETVALRGPPALQDYPGEGGVPQWDIVIAASRPLLDATLPVAALTGLSVVAMRSARRRAATLAAAEPLLAT